MRRVRHSFVSICPFEVRSGASETLTDPDPGIVPSLLFLFSAGSAWRLTLVEKAGDDLASAHARDELLGSTRKAEREERRRDMLAGVNAGGNVLI